MRVYIYAVVEGELDAAVVRRLSGVVEGIEIDYNRIFIKNSKNAVLRNLEKFNRAAEKFPWFVLVDLDREECAPSLIRKHLPGRSRHMCFRVAVRAVEAWLMADREGIAGFLGVSKRAVPAEPEKVLDPKMILVNLARRSRKRDIREALVPDPDTGARVGPLYVPRLKEFIADVWNVREACKNSPSLEGALRCLRAISHSYNYPS